MQAQTEPGITSLAELLVAGSACFIALAALVLAIWEGRQQRRHNRLSVAPKLRLNCVVDGNSRFFGFILSNCGFGPAIVKRFDVTVDGAAVPTPRLHTLASVLAIEDLLTWAFPSHDDVMKPGEDVPLFGTYAKGEAELERMKAALRRIGVLINYESLYGEAHTVSLVGSELRSLSRISLPNARADDSHNTAPPADG